MDTLLSRLSTGWKHLREIYRVLELIRFSLLLGALGAIMMFIAQGQEILLALAESSHGLLERGFFLWCTALFCGISAWYCARTMYRFRFDSRPASASEVRQGMKRWLPRWLGASVLFLSGIACAWAASKTSSWHILAVLAIVLIASGCALLYVLYRRREWLKGLFGLRTYEDEARDFTCWTELETQTKLNFVLLFVLAAVISVAIAYGHSWIGPRLGASGVVMLAAALIIPVGSAIVYWANRHDVPALIGLLVLVLICSFVADNHYVRTHADARGYQQFESVTPDNAQGGIRGDDALRRYVRRWLEARRDERPGAAVPVLIASAEGGGIRAAYWTAVVLGGLHDRAAGENLDLDRYLLGISGVSGGSLGGAVYVALVARGDASTGGGCHGEPPIKSLLERSHRVLDHDFLSPALAVFLFTDLQQRFIPYAFVDDRGVALERSWESAWRSCEGDDQLAEPFSTLWSKSPQPAKDAPPLLLLNSTVVETGQRMIASPFGLSRKNFARSFSDSVDATRVLGDHLPLSTAVHTSARFTYVSPAGTIQYEPDKATGDRAPRWFRVVDGGYFENSGAVTAAELLRVVREVASEPPRIAIRPFVVHISNEPSRDEDSWRTELVDWLTSENKRAIFPGLLSPLVAMLNVRPGRGFQARNALRQLVGDDNHVHFELRDNGVSLPLGWMLSDLSQQDMRRQLGGYPDGERPKPCERARPCDNREAIEKVLEVLRPRS